MTHNPDDDFCVDHNTYRDACLYRHDLPNADDLPDPWPAATGDDEGDE
jgi:hypothetical protein